MKDALAFAAREKVKIILAGVREAGSAVKEIAEKKIPVILGGTLELPLEEDAAYEYYYKCVQLIGMNEPDKRWLLKNPGHIEQLDLLWAIYPDAKVIQTHRDPAKAVPSLCSLLMNLHPIYEEGRSDQRAHNMLAREAGKWAAATILSTCNAIPMPRPSPGC